MSKKIYQVVNSDHHEGDKTYSAGDTLVSAKPLDKLFINKFVCLGDAADVVVKKDAKPAAEEPAAFASDLGDEATAEFGEEVPTGYAVVKKGAAYFVVDRKTPNEAEHDGSLTAKKVPGFLAKL